LLPFTGHFVQWGERGGTMKKETEARTAKGKSQLSRGVAKGASTPNNHRAAERGVFSEDQKWKKEIQEGVSTRERTARNTRREEGPTLDSQGMAAFQSIQQLKDIQYGHRRMKRE